MIISAKLLRSWNACYTDERIASTLARYKRATPASVAADESLSLDDRMWCIAKCLWHLDEGAARLFAIECAETVAHLAGDEDGQAQYRGLLNDMRQIQTDVPEEDRDAAWAAAWAVAGAVAGDAAWAVARAVVGDAAWAAARAAAWAVARAAAWDAAWAAARDAAWAAEIRKSIARALEWLGEEAHS